MKTCHRRQTRWEFLTSMAARWMEADVGTLTASVAYYAAISLFPVMLILTAGIGCFLKWTNYGHDAESYVLSAVAEQVSPALSQNLRVALNEVANHATVSGPAGLLLLLITGLAIFSQFELAFSRIWHQSESSNSLWRTIANILVFRLRAFGLLVGLGLAILIVFVSEIALDTFRIQSSTFRQYLWAWWVVELMMGITVNTIIFTLLYRFAPRVRPNWQHAFRGALFSAAVWELGRQLLTSLVIGQRYSTAYGVIGAMMAIMLWTYYAVGVVFLGAIYIRVLQDSVHRRNPVSEPRSVPRSAAPRRWFRWLDLAFAACLVYIGTFSMAIYARSYRLPQYEPTDQRGKIVVFSTTEQWQDFARFVYMPLIESIPHGRYFPTGEETSKLLEQSTAMGLTRVGNDEAWTRR